MPVATPRPVQCQLCKQQMFYEGDSRFVPEIKVLLAHPLDALYVHQDCLELLMIIATARDIVWPQHPQHPI